MVIMGGLNNSWEIAAKDKAEVDTFFFEVVEKQLVAGMVNIRLEVVTHTREKYQLCKGLSAKQLRSIKWQVNLL